MATSLALRDAVASSRISPSEKTHIRRYWESIAPRASALAARVQRGLGISSHVARTGTQALRAGGEAVLLGGALGVLDGKLAGGLDQQVNLFGGFTVPIDAAAGVAGFAASMVPSLAPVSEDLCRVGVVGAASYAQRQAKAWAQNAAGAGAGTGAGGATGVHGEDEVLRWAQSQG
jgi:hypothetical protein